MNCNMLNIDVYLDLNYVRILKYLNLSSFKGMDNFTLFEEENSTSNNSTLLTPSDNSDNLTSPPGVPSILFLFIFLQEFVFVFSLIGNLAVVVIFALYMKPCITNKFVVNLALNDIGTGLSSGSQVFYYFYPSLARNMYSCFFRFQIISVMTFASQFNVTLVTLDRFIAICKNTAYDNFMTAKITNAMIALAWIIPSAICALPFLGFNKWNEGPKCDFPLLFEGWYYLITSLTIYALMFVTLIMYLLILHKAFSFMRRSLQTTGNQNTERRNALRKNIRSAKVVGTVTIFFIVCWAPWLVYQVRYISMI